MDVKSEVRLMRFGYLSVEELEGQEVIDAWTRRLDSHLSNEDLRIQVKGEDGGYEVTNGRHRLGVALLRGLSYVPVEFVV